MLYSTPGQITIEKTPTYFTTPESAGRINKFNSSIKLILIVKDPTKRIISEYAHQRDHNR